MRWLSGRTVFSALGALAVVMACARDGEVVTDPPPPPPDAGSGDVGSDAGKPDAGPPDAGPPDAGPPDAGPKFGGPGPWPMQNVTYDWHHGIQETPVVGMSTDDKQNLWVATRTALYLMRPGETKFTRFTSKEGLHLSDNPVGYCDSSYPDKACPIYGAGESISEIVGGGPDEVFVGYNGVHDWNRADDGEWTDPYRHSGMLDRVRLNANGTIQVDRMQMLSGDSALFWHNRDVMRLLYDHFQHPHELYVGTNHGVDRLYPDKFVPLPTDKNGFTVEMWATTGLDWMADHLHPQACSCGPCQGENGLLLGDWRGLALSATGDLWVGGRWAAGKILWVAENATKDSKGWFQRGGKSFAFAFGDPYFGNCSGSRPVWCVELEGDAVSISAVTETPDGMAWFASGPYHYQGRTGKNQCNAGDRDQGVASFDPHRYQFTYYSTADIGLPETNVRDMVALPDGRIVFAGPSSGLTFWDPKTKARTVMRAGSGLPDDKVRRLELDKMVSPPVLHVSTETGATSIRITP